MSKLTVTPCIPRLPATYSINLGRNDTTPTEAQKMGIVAALAIVTVLYTSITLAIVVSPWWLLLLLSYLLLLRKGRT